MHMIKKYGDIIAGSFMILFAAAMYVSSLDIKMLTVSRIGAAFMPQIAAILFAVTGVIIVLDGIKTMREAAGRNQDEKPEPVRAKAVVATLASILAYVLLLEKIGFVIMTTLYLFAQFNILADKTERKIPMFLITAVVVSVVVYWVFVNAFQLMLPAGILDWD